jgi:hypothetical protein
MNGNGLSVSALGGTMTIDTSVFMSGNSSTRLDYSSQCYPDLLQSTGFQCGGFTDRGGFSTTNLWTRYYVRFSPGFTIGDSETKLMLTGTSGIYSTWWNLKFGGNTLNAEVQNVPVGYTSNNFASSGVPIDGSWVCIETHEQMNTPGVANGMLEAWINGQLVLSKSNMAYRGSGDNSVFQYKRIYRQVGRGSIWFDRVAVGDSRIGCSGATAAPASDTTPPAAPVGLSLR